MLEKRGPIKKTRYGGDREQSEANISRDMKAIEF